MRMLSVRQPWAHALMHAGKHVENRSWRTRYRGPVAIHAAQTPAAAAAFSALGIARSHVPYSAVIGVAELIDCRDDMHEHTRWADPGRWHWVFSDPTPIEPIPCGGRLRLYEPDDVLYQHIRRALASTSWEPTGRPVNP